MLCLPFWNQSGLASNGFLMTSSKLSFRLTLVASDLSSKLSKLNMFFLVVSWTLIVFMLLHRDFRHALICFWRRRSENPYCLQMTLDLNRVSVLISITNSKNISPFPRRKINFRTTINLMTSTINHELDISSTSITKAQAFSFFFFIFSQNLVITLQTLAREAD